MAKGRTYVLYEIIKTLFNQYENVWQNPLVAERGSNVLDCYE